MAEESKVSGFVSLKSVKHGAPEPAAALAEIRRIYFRTSKRTIDADLAHAIELLKALPDEASRERATVYMEGLAQMRREWGREPARPRAGGTGAPRGRKEKAPRKDKTRR